VSRRVKSLRLARRLKNGWLPEMGRLGLTQRRERRNETITIAPNLGTITLTDWGVRCDRISLQDLGLPVSELAKYRGHLASRFRVPWCAIEEVTSGVAQMEMRHSDPLAEPVRVEDLPAPKRQLHVVTRVTEEGDGLEQEVVLPHLVIGGQGSGKALALDTPIPTPNGWTTMGALQTGDRVFDERGQACKVTKAYPVLHGRPCYEVEFSDGTVIVADADHQWITETRAERVRAGRGGYSGRAPYSDEQLALVRSRAAAAMVEPDRLVTLPEIAAEVGLHPTSGVLHRVGRQIGVAGVVLRPNTTPRGKPCQSPKQGYPRQLLFKALLEAMSTPKNSHRIARHGGTVTTAEIASTLREVGGAARHAVLVAGPLDYPEAELPVPPYVLGAWLGDGTSASATFTTADPEIIDHIRAEGVVAKHYGRYLYGLSLPFVVDERQRRCPCGNWALPRLDRCGLCASRNAATCVVCGARCRGVRCGSCVNATRTLTGTLRTLGVLPGKHIPRAYLQASVQQRRALLAGLLDTDGSCTVRGTVEFYSTNERLARGVLELSIGLGYKATLRSKTARLEGRDCGVAWTVAFTAHEPVFRLARKAERQRFVTQRSRSRRRYIISAGPVPSVPVRCIQVDSPSHLYLASEGCVATHNSTDLWTYFHQLQEAEIPFRARVFDPKGGMELGELRHAAYVYESKATAWPDFLGKGLTALEGRQRSLARRGWQKLYRFTEHDPLDVMVIDELLAVLAMRNKDVQIGKTGTLKAGDAFDLYLSQARAAGFTVIALSQLGQKELIGHARGLFPHLTVLRVPQSEKEIVDRLLGSADRYPAHLIPATRWSAGIGYSRMESGRIVRTRGARLSEDQRELVVERMESAKRGRAKDQDHEMAEAAA
jgi:hypothetical protein